jgi:hypothetical protein
VADVLVPAVLCAVIVFQAVIGARRASEDGARIERLTKLAAADNKAERIAALLPERPAERRVKEDRPSKPLGI